MRQDSTRQTQYKHQNKTRLQTLDKEKTRDHTKDETKRRQERPYKRQERPYKRQDRIKGNTAKHNTIQKTRQIHIIRQHRTRKVIQETIEHTSQNTRQGSIPFPSQSNNTTTPQDIQHKVHE